MNSQVFELDDDSGFLSLMNPDAYCSFVDEAWGYDQLMRHFKAQMRAYHLLIWATGRENIWRVEVQTESTQRQGFREVSGPIVVSNNQLLLANYESLTMAAQFKDITLPEPHHHPLLLTIPNGIYHCRIIQLCDPEIAAADGANPGQLDFVLELSPSEQPIDAWSEVPWITG